MQKYAEQLISALICKVLMHQVLAVSLVLTKGVPALARDKFAEIYRLESVIAAASQSTCRFVWQPDKWIATRVQKSPTKVESWSPTTFDCPELNLSVVSDWQDLLIALEKEHDNISHKFYSLPGPEMQVTARYLMHIGTTFLCARLITGSQIPPSIVQTFSQAASLAKVLKDTSISDAAQAFHSIWYQTIEVHDKGEPSCLFFKQIVRDQPKLLVLPKLITKPRPSRKGVAKPIDDATWQLMQGKSWHPNKGCPERDQLSLLTVPYIDFFGKEREGKMIVAKSTANDVLAVFSELYRIRFPIASMRLIHQFNGNDAASMAANNTSAFNCRPVTGGSRLSEHAYGAAIDINPIQNPYVAGQRVQPPSGQRFAAASHRQRSEPGLIVAGDAVVAAFAKIGWKWGGAWSTPKDFQHFSKTGR